MRLISILIFLKNTQKYFKKDPLVIYIYTYVSGSLVDIYSTKI